MTPERWREIQAIFETALEVSKEERHAFLGRACAKDETMRDEVAALLAADEGADDLLDGTAAEALGFAQQAPAAGRVIGSYKLLHPLGAGGMGEVFLAERHGGGFEQLVALKLLRADVAGGQVLRRFAAERQILAHLAHEHIARLLDGGADSDGRPFFAMEYVSGTPIDEHCDREQLSIRDRLRLFGDVCRAAAYAHRRLVVHRDLKPDNILVTEDGAVKLLDFGIAKVIDPDDASVAATDPRVRMMTPQYAAPEQISGEPVTTATDVYALGVLLYRLLAGALPYRVESAAHAELERIVCRSEIPPASETARRSGRSPGRVGRDLDAICARALARRAEDRYPSAAELGADVERYLALRPVKARGGAPLDRIGKAVRRHRLAALAAAAALLAATGIGGAAIGRIAAERDRAGQRAAELTGKLDRAARALGRSGRLLLRRGQTEAAEPLLREAHAILAGSARADPESVRRAAAAWSACLRELGRDREADAVLGAQRESATH